MLTAGFQLMIGSRMRSQKGIKEVQDSNSVLATRFQRVLGFSNVHTRSGGFQLCACDRFLGSAGFPRYACNRILVSAVTLGFSDVHATGLKGVLGFWAMSLQHGLRICCEFIRISGNAGFQ